MSSPRSSASSRRSRSAPISPPARGTWKTAPATGSCSTRRWTRPCDSRVTTTPSGSSTAGTSPAITSTYREAMSFLWKGWPEPVQAGPSAPRVRDIILPDEAVATRRRGSPRRQGADVQRPRRGVLRGRPADDKIHRIGLDGKIERVPVRRRSCQQPVRRPERRALRGFEPDREGHELRPVGQGSLVVDGLRGQHVLATPERRPVRHQQRRQAGRIRQRLVRQGRQEDAGRLRS